MVQNCYLSLFSRAQIEKLQHQIKKFSRQLSRLCLSPWLHVLIEITVCSEVTFDEDLCRVETSQLIFIAKPLFGFYMARDIIEGYFRTFYGFLNVTLFTHLCFRLIELMTVGFFLYLTCCLITIQECAKLFRFKDTG